MTTSGPLATALDKLAQAVEVAEAAAAERARDATAAPDTAALEAALADLRRDHSSLKTVTDDVARRLDGAIERVEAILEGRS